MLDAGWAAAKTVMTRTVTRVAGNYGQLVQEPLRLLAR